MNAEMRIGNRLIGEAHPPLVIAEIGINHEGDIDKAVQMVDDAHNVGCECVKFQSHIVEDEMIPNDVIPGNADESIWDIMLRCSLTKEEDRQLKDYVENRGMIYLSTPFSRAAANHLESMGVVAYKIGSGECNNYPLIKHVASFGKPIILSTGMNSIESIGKAVAIFREVGVAFSLLHCTSIYPTPYEKVRLGALDELHQTFPDAVIGLSDHSLSNYPCMGAIAKGASIVERHFTSSKDWPGPDIPISMTPDELKELIEASYVLFLARGGHKEVLEEEQPTIDFAYATVVAEKDISQGDTLTADNVWVKRPGTGEILAEHYSDLLGRKARRGIKKNEQLRWSDLY
jgi:N-acetylneuraminate synthase